MTKLNHSAILARNPPEIASYIPNIELVCGLKEVKKNPKQRQKKEKNESLISDFLVVTTLSRRRDYCLSLIVQKVEENAHLAREDSTEKMRSMQRKLHEQESGHAAAKEEENDEEKQTRRKQSRKKGEESGLKKRKWERMGKEEKDEEDEEEENVEERKKIEAMEGEKDERKQMREKLKQQQK